MLSLGILLLFTSISAYFRFITGYNFFIYSDIGGDTFQSYIPQYYMVVQKLAGLDFTFLEFSYGLGSNNILSAQGVIFDPFSIPIYLVGVLFGVHTINYMVIWMYIARIFCAAYFCYFYLSMFRLSNTAKTLAAYLYGFNGFILLWGQHYMFGSAVVFLILILFCVERCLQYFCKQIYCNCALSTKKFLETSGKSTDYSGGAINDKSRETNSKYLLLLALSTFVMFLNSYFWGYMIVVFSAMYVVFRVAQICSLKDWFIGLRSLFYIGLSASTGFILSMFITVPALMHLLSFSDRVPEGGAWSRFIIWLFRHFGYLRRNRMYETIFLRLFSNNFQGVGNYFEGAINYYESPQYFFSSFLLILAVTYAIYFFMTNINIKTRLLFMVAAFFVVYYVTMPTLPLVFNAFIYPIFRTSFLIIPIFAFVAASSFDIIFLTERPRAVNRVIYLSIFLSMLVCLYVVLSGLSRINASTISMSMSGIYAGITLVLFCAFVFVLYLHDRVNSSCSEFMPQFSIDIQKRCLLAIVVIVVLNVSVEAYVTANHRYPSTMLFPQIKQADYDQATRSALNFLQESDMNFYRVEKAYFEFFRGGIGEPLRQRYNGLSTYNSVRNPELVKFVNLMWPEIQSGDSASGTFLGTNAWRNPQLSALLNVKYFLAREGSEIAHMQEYQLMNTIDGIDIYRNLWAGGFGILFYNYIAEHMFLTYEQPEKLALLRDYVVLDIPFSHDGTVESYYFNDMVDHFDGYADRSVAFQSIRNNTHLTAWLTTVQDGYLFLPLPWAEDGWNIYINGERADIYRANIAFIAVAVSEGTHFIELRYRTPGLILGGAVSAIGVVMFFALALYVFKSKRVDR